ncbi:MAG: hypothetical protein ACPGO5_04390 [Patescibacteria group bacterium]
MQNTKPQKKNTYTRFRKFGASVAIVLMLSVGVLAVKPQPAHALFGIGDISITAGDIPRTIYEVINKIWRISKETLVRLAQLGLIHAVDTYVQNLAYETALRVATGSPGQEPLVYGKPILQGLQDVGDAALGDYLDTLSKDLFGTSLCEPLNPDFKLRLTIMLEQSQQPPQPRCSLTEIRQNGLFSDASWENTKSSLRSLTLEDTVNFSSYFDSTNNQLGTLRMARQAIEDEQRKKKDAELFKRAKSDFKDKTNPTGQKIEVPASEVDESLERAIDTGADKSTPEKPNPDTGDLLLNVLARGLNTFSKTFLGAWTKTLFDDDGLIEGAPGPSDAQFITATSGIQAAREYYSRLIEQSFATEVDVDVSNQLASCPANETAQQWNNCRISQGMKTAIDEKITVEEAIDKGYIEPGEIFGYNRDRDGYPEYNQGLPYASLVVMRKYRVVPVGWELAAQYIRDVMRIDDHDGKQIWTISDMIYCYEDSEHPEDNTYPRGFCQLDPDDPNSVNPFYHLVNPDWVLKSPETRCYQEGPGPELAFEQTIQVPIENPISGIGSGLDGTIAFEQQRIVSRIDWCADEQSCIQYDDETGKCEWWGHCVQERPAWEFTADKCPSVYNTCESLEKVSGSYGQTSPSSEAIGFLTKTMESCSISDVGCSWYSLAYDLATEQWEGNTDINLNGEADRLYLSGSSESCNENDAGCTLFYKAADNSDPVAARLELESLWNDVKNDFTPNYTDSNLVEAVYLKEPPADLNCDYGNPARDDDCDKYAQICSEAELGCMYYTPLTGDPKIPGKITPADQCDERCVGFDMFTYVGSWFEDAEDDNVINESTSLSVAVLPETGEQCSQTGCERFTNLNDVAEGGEGIEYYTQIRQCVTPGSTGTKTYFTWEGSDTSGYQLKRWVMLEGSGGAPCTGVVPGDPENCSATVSCPDTSDPACRSFFDESGNTYWASINDVIYAADDCTPLRRELTGTVYFGIPSLSQQCGSENVGCREYKGPGANNVRVVFVDTFEAEDAPSTDASGLLFDWQGGGYSSESLELNGHSMEVDALTKKSVDSYGLQQGKQYTLSFVAKGSNLDFSISDDAGNEDAFTSVGLSAEWQFYQIGPVEISHPVLDTEVIQVSGSGFVDNIVLRETVDNYLLIQDSWDVDLVNNICLPNSDFNCQLYQPDIGDIIALKSFSTLCEDRFVGCVAMVDTQNSDQAFTDPVTGNLIGPAASYTWNTDNNDPLNPITSLDDITVPADQMVFMVDNPDMYCQASEKGCMLVGQPIFDRQLSEDANFTSDDPACNGIGADCSVPLIIDGGFVEVPIINDPDQYITQLCTADVLFCSLYDTGNGSQKSFVDPGNRVCEYVSTPTQGKTIGWYRTGTDILCSTVGGSEENPFQPVPSDSASYTGWAGLCPTTYHSCSQLVDPEPQSIDETHEYVLHDQLVDGILECSQEGVVDRDGGCRLFADTESYSTTIAVNSIDAYDPTISLDGQAPQSSTLEEPVGSGIYPDNTANILIKVTPDRECDEFLYCSSELTFDNSVLQENVAGGLKKSQKGICLGIGRCSQLDATGNCIDSTADILLQGQTVFPQSISNDRVAVGVDGGGVVNQVDRDYLYAISDAKWSTGMNKFGASWPQGSVEGYYPYHYMEEVGSPITVPNSNFEDKQNFGQPYSSWPDADNNGTILQENVRIVGKTAGIFPYEGSFMLEMEMDDPDPATPPGPLSYITSAELPSSPGLTMAVSMYINFNNLKQPDLGICTGGDEGRVGFACATDSECLDDSNGLCEVQNTASTYYNYDGKCSCQFLTQADPIEQETTMSYAFMSVLKDLFTTKEAAAIPGCYDTIGECNAIGCDYCADEGTNCSPGEYQCSISCDPNHSGSPIDATCNPGDDEIPSGSETGKCWGEDYKFRIYCGVNEQICTAGGITKLGQLCTSNSECNATDPSPAEGDLCEPVGSILKVNILDGEDPTDVLFTQDVVIAKRSGWKQITLPFTITGSNDTFRVELRAEEPASAPSSVSGSIMVDNLEVRSGLQVNDSIVVAPSCRLYPRVDGLETDALACEFTDRGNITGQKLTTYKGWRGYCVEEVPDEPGICMSWWPVDIVQGDVNFFGQGTVDDITINGQTPASDIYYCVHTTGDLSNSQTRGGYSECVDVVGGNPPVIDCDTFTTELACDANAPTCIWDQYDNRCDGGQVSQCLGQPDEASCTAITDCEWKTVAANVSQTPYLFQGGTTRGDGTIFGSPTNERLFKGGKDKCNNWSGLNWGVIPYTFGGCSKNCSDWSSKPCHNVVDLENDPNIVNKPERDLHKSMIQTIKFQKTSSRGEYPDWFVLDRSLEIDEESIALSSAHDRFTLNPGETAWYLPCGRNNPPSGENGDYCEKSPDWLHAAVVFDPAGYVARYWYAMDDYSGSKSEAAAWVVGYYLRDLCLSIVQANTSYGSRTPWTSRFNDGDDALPYEIDQDALPYGAIAPPSLEYLPDSPIEENPWRGDPIFAMSGSESLYCGDSLLPQSCAREGSPYSCQDNCGDDSSGKVCIGGVQEKLGKSCRTNNDCADTEVPESKGVCGGVTGDISFHKGSCDGVICTPYASNHGTKFLSRLFAKSQAIFGWDFINNQYVRCDADQNVVDMPAACVWPRIVLDSADFNANYNGGSFDIATKTWPINGNTEDGVVLEEYDITGCGWPGFTYNGTSVCSGIDSTGKAPEVQDLLADVTEGDVTIISGDFITLQFFPSVNKDRLPLKAMRVDWGDGTHLKPNQDLSNLAGQGLPINTYFFVHHYTCEEGGLNWSSSEEACIFVPRIQIKDNWGWCSRDDANPNGIYECDEGEGFTDYEGRILVKDADYRREDDEIVHIIEEE